MNDDSPLRIAETMATANVPFVIIGGHAVNYHGFPRATQDVDIIFKRSDESVKALYEALSKLEGCWISNELDPETGIEKTVAITPEYIAREHLMMLSTKLGYLDLFDFIPGLPNEPLDELFATAETIGSLRFASLNWLRRMKQASGRPQDKIDLENLPSSES